MDGRQLFQFIGLSVAEKKGVPLCVRVSKVGKVLLSAFLDE